MRTVMTVAASASLFAGSTALGAVAYDNFGPGDGVHPEFNHYIVQATTTNFGGLSLRHGQQFTAEASGTADSFKYLVFLNEGTPAFTLRLFTDSGVDTLGSQIGGDVTVAYTSGMVGVADVSAGGWELEAGQTYWFTVQAALNSEMYWPANAIGDVAGAIDSALGANGTVHNYAPPGNVPGIAFALNVVPAPATVAMLGLAGVVASRRRRRLA